MATGVGGEWTEGVLMRALRRRLGAAALAITRVLVELIRYLPHRD